MKSRWTTAVLLAAGLIAATMGAVPTAQAVDAHASSRAKVIEYWTADRIATAIPRDVLVPAKAPSHPFGKPGGGSSVVLAATWPGDGSGGLVEKTTGTVFFTLGTTNYACSGSVVEDDKTDRSLVITAGHCVYDETRKVWATNWMFIPDFGAGATSCQASMYGCWTADVLVASRAFTEAGSFNDTAVVHDYAFAVVGEGGRSLGQLDEAVGAQHVTFTALTNTKTAWLFGYPSAGKYNRGNVLMYSSGPLGTDASMDGATYRLGSTLTAGSSGGPWFQPLGTATTSGTYGVGTIFSVTSYGYPGVKALFGPKFGTETANMYAAAQAAGLDDNNIAYSER